MGIARDDAILGGEPRIDGTRIGVRHVAARVVDGGQTPAHVADHLDSTLADVYEARSSTTPLSRNSGDRGGDRRGVRADPSVVTESDRAG